MWTNLIVGTVGSTAYGLAGPTSDVDTLVVAAAPSRAFFGLNPPTLKSATRVSNDPDVTTHEAAKFLSLCLAANPTVNELLWLPEDCYRDVHPLGTELIDLRRELLSAKRVRDAYLGYATAQFKRMRDRGDGSFSSDTRLRTAKHARHLLRLTTCGLSLYLTGEMAVRLPDPQRYRTFGELVAAEPEKGLELAEAHLATVRMAMDSKPSALPEEPNHAAAEDWLIRVREHFYREG